MHIESDRGQRRSENLLEGVSPPTVEQQKISNTELGCSRLREQSIEHTKIGVNIKRSPKLIDDLLGPRSAFLDPSADGSKKFGPSAKVPDNGSQPGTGHLETNPDSGDSISDRGKIL